MNLRDATRFGTLFAGACIVPALAWAQTPVQATRPANARQTSRAAEPAPRATSLPVTRVLLYKNGVGFFEHAGSVTGNERVTIDFTSAQLNDVLQSLTAVDLGGGHIAGAGYSSATPLDQQLRSLPLGLGAEASADDLYQALRGARVEVHTGAGTLAGRLLNVEQRNSKAVLDAADSTAIVDRYLTLVSDAGAVSTVRLDSKTQIRLLDTELHGDVTRYLEALGSNRSQGLRHLTLEADGTGTRPFRVSYISEVPVWKATYRILFGNAAAGGAPEAAPGRGDSSETATLQGWAVVDNTVGTDWNNVQLSLIAGAPQSFIQPLSQAYYARRPEIGLPQEAQLTPQTHESGDLPVEGRAAAQFVAVEPQANAMDSMVAPNNGAIGTGSGSGFGTGVGGGVLRSSAGKQVAIKAAVPALSYEDSAAASLAPDTKTAGFDDYFEYKLGAPVTIRKNESALVPILQTKVETERVTLWSPAQPTALRALWLNNSSDLTLDRGSFSIVEDGKFGGEGLLDPVHPHEKRLLSYAADQAVHVTTESRHDSRRLQQVAVSRGILTESTVEVAEQEYLVRNAAAETRTVIVEQPRRAGWELDSDPKPIETTATAYRFRVATAPGETVRLHVGERHTLSQRYQLADLGEDRLDLLLRSDGDNPRLRDQLRDQLRPILDAKHHLADLDGQIAAKQAAIDDIGKDQERLRANLAALKGSSEERALVKRYTGELNAQEDKVNALRNDQAGLRAEHDAAQRDLSARIESLQMNEQLGS